MMKSTQSIQKNQQRLEQVRLALDRFFYKVRLNIYLLTAFKTQDYAEFRETYRAGIIKQISSIATADGVNRIVGLSKAVASVVDPELLDGAKRYLPAIFDVIEEEESVKYLNTVASYGSYMATSKLGQPTYQPITDKAILGAVTKEVKLLGPEIDATTASWVSRTIEQGLQDQASNIQIAKLIRDNMENHANNRANLIAENETAHMMGYMENEIYRRNGIVSVRWITARDERVCPICYGNETAGEIATGTLYPSGNQHPPAHQRCRCFVMPKKKKKTEVTWTG